MKRKRLWLASCLIVCSVAGAALAQQKVPPPPRPPDEPTSAMEATAKSLEEKLKSFGRMSWALTVRDKKTNEVTLTGPEQPWAEVTRLSINPHTCEMRVAWNENNAESGGTYFLEEIEAVDVYSWEQPLNNGNPGVQYTTSPAMFSVKFGSAGFPVRGQETANQIADAFRQLAQQCKASLRAAKSGGEPSWEDTMTFIEDKLNQQGAVNYLTTYQNSVDGTVRSQEQSDQFSRVRGDPQSCRLNYHVKTIRSLPPPLVEYDGYLNLRRVEKLAVMSLQDQRNDANAREGHPEMVQVISPAVWVLVVTDPRGIRLEIPFRDEDMANRVAKALTHAVELCGGGSKEPF
jgi:hypothetical protein